MATARPFAFNLGAPIPGTEQIGNLAIGTPTAGFASTGLDWWNGADEDLGYVIAEEVPGDTQPTPIFGELAQVGFFRSALLTENSFKDLANIIAGASGPFASGSLAKTWLNDNGYWTSFTSGATGFITTVTQVGPDVVWSGSGSLNLTDLTSLPGTSITSGYAAGEAIWIAGAPLGGIGATMDVYSGIATFPASFGGAGSTPPTSSTGNAFGILLGAGGIRTLAVHSGYVSGTFLSGSTTYGNTTIAGMNLTPGTYVYSWGSGANADSLTLIIG